MEGAFLVADDKPAALDGEPRSPPRPLRGGRYPAGRPGSPANPAACFRPAGRRGLLLARPAFAVGLRGRGVIS